MQRTLTIKLGVVIAREEIDHPWQDHVWRPVAVFLNAPEIDDWRELRRGDGFVQYHAATLPLTLHRKETPGYCENLDSDAPALYVILRETDIEEDSKWPVEVHLVTASAHEVEAYGEDGSEIIGPVAMPEQVFELISAFIDEHHNEEPFVKRKRSKYHIAEEHKFGHESIDELRRRNKPDDAPLAALTPKGARDKPRG